MTVPAIFSRRFAGLLRLAALLCAAAPGLRAAEDLSVLWRERVKCTVAVEFYTETEAERRPSVSYGTVVDAEGTIIMPSVAVNSRTTPGQLKEFKVYRPGNPDGLPARYLGQDTFTGWHFVRVDEGSRAELVPVTAFVKAGAPEPVMAQEVWGIGLRNKDEDFTPYLLSSRIAILQFLPQRTAIAQQEVAGPGLPVFNRDGVFAGLAASSFGQNYVQFSREDRGGFPVIMVNVEESGAFFTADEIVPYLGRVPQNVHGRPLAWLGAYGLEPMDPEVARFLNLSGQSGAVISEVLEGSPAEKAGLKGRDLLVAIDGKPLPRLKPDRVIVSYVEREVQRRRPGDGLGLTVLRGPDRLEFKVVLGEEPRLLSEAERKYFDRLGVTAREFVNDDAIARLVKAADWTGVIAHYVKPNSPAAAAGLRPDDWIKEIDGAEVKNFATAAEKLAAIDGDKFRTECVLLVSRGGMTSVLRIKL